MVKETNDFLLKLRRRKPFDRMEEKDVHWLAEHMQQVEFQQGDPILLPGKPCAELFFIHLGVVQLEAMGDASAEQKVLAELVEGESFPLEALEENRPVFSTFRAKTATVCYRLDLHDFGQLKKRSKIFADFCQYRSACFLEQSRRVYRLHFSHQSEEQQRLSTPLSILLRPDPLTFSPDRPLREVLSKMHETKDDLTVIIDGEQRAVGIFTIYDLLRNVILPTLDLDAPVGSVMRAAPQTLPVSALGYEAALAMAGDGHHHIIVEAEGRLAGTVTEQDLFNLQRVSLHQLNAQIRSADSVDWLKQCSRDIQLLAENMIIQGVTSDQLTQIISTLNDQIISRTLDLELAGQDFDGIRVCWIALGSQGRFEQTFSTDQDNGIIFEAQEGMDPDAVRARLLPLAQRVNRSLDVVGFPLCKGNIMAGNPACCLTFKEWQKKFVQWIQEPTPEALLNATIFFDFRHLYGDAALSDRLRRWLADAVLDQKRFFYLLAQNALQRTPPLGFFRDFVVDDNKEHPNTIDIKVSGVTLFVDAARVYALASGVTRGNTKQRLIAAGDIRKWPQSEVNAWADAFSFLQSLRIRHQFELERIGSKSHNRLNPYELNNLDRKFFLESLRQAGQLQKRLSADFGM